MKKRRLGKTGFQVSEISVGTWQVGGRWGDAFDADNAKAILEAAVDSGVNFIDTADVYSGGLSEKAVGAFVKSRSERIYVATKCGRQLNPHVSRSYTPEALTAFVENSLKNSGLDCLDLIQLHCPPTDVYYRPEIFELFDKLKTQGKILNLGVSVEKVEEANKAMEYPNVTSVQIIFNMFRQRPRESFLALAKLKDVGVIVRVPLASGLLSGKFAKDTAFGAEDHRHFNVNGEAFDKGETFSGVPYETGLAAVEELKAVFPEPFAAWALRWILAFPEVSCVIPGASRPDQALANTAAAQLKAPSPAQMKTVDEIYAKYVKKHVHQLW